MPPTTSRKPSRRRKLRQRAGWAYASPVAATVLVFFIIPIVLVLYMSGTDWKLLSGNQGVNFPDNYQSVVTHRLFWPAVTFTLKYTVIATVLLIAIGLGLALLVQESSRWHAFLRTTILLPTALGLASASLLFYALYSPQVGPLKKIFAHFGIDAILGSGSGALWATVFVIVWRFAGFHMLLLLVGLQGIDAQMYEAARMDGATVWQMFTRITLPLLRPSLSLSLIMCVTGSLLAFDQFYILTKGGPDGKTMTVVQLIYNLAFESKRSLGLAAALSVVVLVVLVIINVFQLKAMRGDSDE